MSKRKGPAADPETERLLREVIGVLAEACAEADRHGLSRPRVGVTARRLSAAGRMRPLALALARRVAAGDADGADRLLSVQRPASQWRELALILASAADPECLAAVPHGRSQAA